MIRYLFHKALVNHPQLAQSMYQDRARQFGDRLGWPVTIDEAGNETDEYDDYDPIYVIWEPRPGVHGGSMRLLPTNGPNMLCDHFPQLSQYSPSPSSKIWESSRLCLSPNAPARVSAALMLGGCDMASILGIDSFVGVFNLPMQRVYRRLGWPPKILSTMILGDAPIALGQWHVTPDLRARLIARARISREIADHWRRRGFGTIDRLIWAA